MSNDTDWRSRPFNPATDSLVASIEIQPDDLTVALSEHQYDDVDVELHASIVRRAVALIELQAVDLIDNALERAIYQVVHESIGARR